MNLSRVVKQSLIFLSIICCTNLATAEDKDAVLAKVGSKVLTLGEFNEKLEQVKAQTLNPPSKEDFLEDLVRYYVGLQEAEKSGLRNDPQVKEKMENELYKGWLEKTLGPNVSKIQVSDNQMMAFYKNNPEIRSSHILIEYKRNASDDEIRAAKKRALEIYEKEVKNSKRPFEELVRLFSDDTLSKQAGGDIGWQTRNTLYPSYYEAALKTDVGQIRGLIQTPYGFHILKVTGKHSYKEANKRQIRAAVFDEMRKEQFQKHFKKIKGNYSIDVNTKLLK